MPLRKYRTRNIKISKNNKENLIKSVFIAYEKSIELNRFLTVNLEECCSKDPMELLRFILDRYTKFSVTHRFEAAYIRILENNHSNNLHAHILLHIPRNKEEKLIIKFKKKLRSIWFKNSNKNIIKERNWFKCKTISYGLFKNNNLLLSQLSELDLKISDNDDTMECAKEINENNRVHYYGKAQFYDPINIVAYMLKGIKRNTQGEINGNRFSCSKNLAKASKNSGI